METLDPPQQIQTIKTAGRGGRATLVISGRTNGPVIIYRRGGSDRVISLKILRPQTINDDRSLMTMLS